MPKYEDFIPNTDMANPVFKRGLRFANATMFRKTMRIYSINHGRELTFKKNDPTTIRVVCHEECPFVLHASTTAGSTYLQVKTCNPRHRCSRGSKNKHANAKWLAQRYSTQLRLNPNWTASSFSFAEQVFTDYGYHPSRTVVYRARALVVDIVEGSFINQYEAL